MPAPTLHDPVDRRSTRAAVVAAFVLLGALVVATLPAPTASAAPASRTPGRTIEAYSRYEPQTTCSPQAKPGVVAFMKMALRAYPGTGSSGIVRACLIGARSEHKEGRAWDWRLSVANPRQRAQASSMAAWLFAPDAYGNRRAQARRLGLMYVIWNRKIWSSTDPDGGWRPYSGPDSHTTHMHFSFSILGGLGRTSFWTGQVPPSLLPPPAPAPVPFPVPAPAPPAPAATPLPDSPLPEGAPVGPAPEGPVPTGPAPTVPAATAPAQPVLDSGAAEVSVPASGSRVTTSFALRAGRRYRLTATGTYHYAQDWIADAECNRRPDGRWRTTSEWEGTPGYGHLDLEVAGEQGDWAPRTDSGRGCDLGDHVYTRTVLATKDAPLVVRLVDDIVTDNSGSLTLRVATLDPATPTD